MADESITSQLGIINANLNKIFGTKKSIFIATTPRAYLFEGIRFCIDTTGMAKLICDVIKEESSKGLVALADGSIQFSFFDHVGMHGTADDYFM